MQQHLHFWERKWLIYCYVTAIICYCQVKLNEPCFLTFSSSQNNSEILKIWKTTSMEDEHNLVRPRLNWAWHRSAQVCFISYLQTVQLSKCPDCSKFILGPTKYPHKFESWAIIIVHQTHLSYYRVKHSWTEYC